MTQKLLALGLLTLALMTISSATVFAADSPTRLLSCANANGPRTGKALHMFQVEGALDTLGQTSLGHYHSVNLVCNNGQVLRDLKEDILCAGVDRSPYNQPRVVQVRIRHTSSGYMWNGMRCSES